MERAQSSPRRAGTEQSGISSDDDPVAQSAEQLPFKQWVRGSNPRRVTTSEQAAYRLLRLFSKVRARSLRCSSFPNRTRFAGLRFGFGRSLERKSILPTYYTSERNPLHSVSRRSLSGTALKLRCAPLLLLSNSNPLRWASSWLGVHDGPSVSFLSMQD